MKKRARFHLLVLVTVGLLGVAAGVWLTLTLTVEHPDTVGAGVWSDQSPMPLPTLQTLTHDATTDAEALQAIADYFDAHETSIARILDETDDTRLRGLFAMYIVHVSNAYRLPDAYDGFLGYIRQPYGECNSYSANQQLIATALGLTTRRIAISGGTHVWLEAWVHGQWEVFDATVNVWLDREGYALMRGEPRHYRAFYTPLLDEAAPHTSEMLSGQRLRLQMPGLGIYYFPKAVLGEM